VTDLGFDPRGMLGGRYVVRREIGRGGVCVVSEAVHRLTGRVVAVKQLLQPARARADLRARLAREAEALGAIRHPNVVDILDADEDHEGVPFLVLERLGGRTLEGILAARTRLDVREAMNLAWQTCAAVAAAHASGVVHRDVKPENLVCLEAGETLVGARVKLIDFGIATAPRSAPEGPRLTKAETVLGTPEYMPLERLTASAPPSPAFDLYAIGVTLYECLAGRVPYPGDYRSVLQKAAAAPPPPVESLRPDVPKPLAAFVAKAIAREPERRFPTATAMAQALEQIAEEMSRAGPKPAPAVAPAPPPRRLREVPPSLRVPPDGPPSSPAVSRRKTRRAPYRAPVRLELDTGTLDARSEDLSAGGIFLLLAPDVPRPGVGARAAVRFALPSTGEVVQLHGVIRWVKPREGGATAVGVEFVSLPARVQQALEHFVKLLGQDFEE
jgi:serine/threonine-protein kinase